MFDIEIGVDVKPIYSDGLKKRPRRCICIDVSAVVPERGFSQEEIKKLAYEFELVSKFLVETGVIKAYNEAHGLLVEVDKKIEAA